MEYNKSRLPSSPPAEEMPVPIQVEPTTSIELAKYREIEGPISPITIATIASIVERSSTPEEQPNDTSNAVFFGG